MQFQISPSSLEKLQAELPRLSPWMHAFSFNDTIYTGYYKNTGQNKTYWTTEDSNLGIVKSLFNEYMSKRPFYHMDYLLNYFGERKSKIRALDIASATGRFSFYLAGQGVGQVKGVEIRAEQVEQANLILDIVPEFSREQLTFEHESISADAPEFREGETYDLVLSMGLLYHLPNPLQHLHNLARLTKEVLILHTLIHREQPNTWKLVAEDAAFITKSFQGVSWIGHYMEVERWLKAAGFARVESLVPPGLENLADMFQLKTISTPASYADRLMRRAGVKPSIESYVKTQNFLVHNPYYFTYIAYRH